MSELDWTVGGVWRVIESGQGFVRKEDRNEASSALVHPPSFNSTGGKFASLVFISANESLNFVFDH